jgi:hypothetical protein
MSDDDVPLVQAVAQRNGIASGAPTPQRKRVCDFYTTVPTSEYIQTQDKLMQPDELDLRNIFKSGVRVGKLMI